MTGAFDQTSTFDQLQAGAARQFERLLPGGALASHPPIERWDDWVELDARAWARGERRPRCRRWCNCCGRRLPTR